MSAGTRVLVLDPVNPRALFDSARTVVRSTGKWKLHNGRGFEINPMYFAGGKDATVAVHFPAVGGFYSADLEDEADWPARAYAVVGFGTGYYRGEEATREHHVAIVRRLFEWLDTDSIRMSWQFEEDPWVHGAPAASRNRR